MRPSDEEIANQVKSISDRQRKLYRLYKLKSFFGLQTKGLDEANSLILSAILKDNKNSKFSFVVVNNIDKTDTDHTLEFHKKALRIDENDYVTIFFNAREKFGDFVIGENVMKALDADFLETIRSKFKLHVSRQNYIKATEVLVKSINQRLANA